MARSDAKKQEQGASGRVHASAKVKAPSEDQLRLAEMMDGREQEKTVRMVKYVMDVTNASEDKVLDALHRCGYNQQEAIHSLLEGDVAAADDEWTSVTCRSKKALGRSKAPESSLPGSGSSAHTSREDHFGSRGGRSGSRGGIRGGASAGMGGRTARPAASNRVKRAPAPAGGDFHDNKHDDTSWPAVGGDGGFGGGGFGGAEKLSGAWATGAESGRSAAAVTTSMSPNGWATPVKSAPVAAPVAKVSDESDKWSTDANATPGLDRIVSSHSQHRNWADETVTPVSSGAPTVSWPAKGGQWVDTAAEESAAPAAWPATDLKEESAPLNWCGTSPSPPVVDTTVQASATPWTVPPEEVSHRSQIEDWRDNVEDHASEWQPSPLEQVAEPVANTAAEAAGAVEDNQPAPEQLPQAAHLVVELPITPLEEGHRLYPVHQPEVIKTAMYIHRSQVPMQPVVMPELNCVLSAVSNIQFGSFQLDTTTSHLSLQEDRHEYLPTTHQTIASPSSSPAAILPPSSLDTEALGSVSPGQNVVALESPLATHPAHHSQMSPLTHVRPLSGHLSTSPAAVAGGNGSSGGDAQPVGTEGFAVDSAAGMGAKALLSLNSDLLHSTASGAIPIPGASTGGLSSSQHSTPSGSLATAGTSSSFMDRDVPEDPSRLYICPDTPLIVGTPPVAAQQQQNVEAQLQASASHPAAPQQQQQNKLSHQVTTTTQTQSVGGERSQSSTMPTTTTTTAATAGRSASQPTAIQTRPQSHHNQSGNAHHQHHQSHSQSSHSQSHSHTHASGNTSSSSSSSNNQSGHHHHHHHHQPQQQQQQQQQTSYTSGSQSSATTATNLHAPPGMANLPGMRLGMKNMPPNMMMGHTPNPFVPASYMGMPMMPGYSGEFDATHQRNMPMSGVRADGNSTFQGSGDSAKYGHEGSSSSSSILGTPGGAGMNFLAQPQQQQMLSYYPGVYMPMMPFHALYGNYPPVPKGAPYGSGAPGFMPPPVPAYGQNFDDADYKSSSYQASTQTGNKASNSQSSYNSSAGGNLGASTGSYKSHYDKSNYPGGNNSGLFPTPGNPANQAQAQAQAQAAAVAAYQLTAAGIPVSQHAGVMMGPGMPGAALHGQSLHTPPFPMIDGSASAASGQAQVNTARAGGPGASGSAQHGAPSVGGASSAKHQHHALNTTATAGFRLRNEVQQ